MSEKEFTFSEDFFLDVRPHNDEQSIIYTRRFAEDMLEGIDKLIVMYGGDEKVNPYVQMKEYYNQILDLCDAM